MSDEPTIRLGNIATLEMGQSPPSSVVVEGDGGVPFLQGCAEFGPQYPRPHYSCLKPPKVCRKGDVLISVRAPVGIINKADREYCIGRGLAAVRLSDEFPEGYAWHLLSYWAPGLRRVAQGTTFEAINRDDLANLKVVNIAPEDRSVLVAILDAADQAIAKTETLIAKLKAIKQGLLHDLLTRGLDENGELRDPEKHPEQFKATPLGRIPIAWDVLTINDLAVHVGSGITPTGGSNVYKSEGVLFIRSQNVTFEGLLLDDVAYIDERTHQMMIRSEIFAHDVLLNITGASIGRCCPVPEGLGPANVNQHVCAIRTAKPCREDAVFLAAVLASFIGQHQIDRLNAGSNRQGLNYQQLRSFLVPWPRQDAERAAISTKIELAEMRLRAEEAYLSKLKAIKKGLMEDLLTGRVRVNTKQETREE